MTTYVVRISGRRIDGETYSGTGFIVSSTGFVLTCAHVIEGARSIFVKIPYEKRRPYVVHSTAPDQDLALLAGEVPSTLPTPVAVLDTGTSQADVGRDVVVLGHSSSKHYNTAQRYSCNISAFSESTGRIGLSCLINEGDSGGPVLNEEGRVIAVVQSRDPARVGHAQAIPIARALALLRNSLPGYATYGPATTQVIHRALQHKTKAMVAGLMPETEATLVGRSMEVNLLHSEWDAPDTNIVTLVAEGGVGKTALVNHWLREMSASEFRGARFAYAWSFYGETAGPARTVSAVPFVRSFLAWLDLKPDGDSPIRWVEQILEALKNERTLLVIDGLEVLQHPPGLQEGRLKDRLLRLLLRELALHNAGLCVCTSRVSIHDLSDFVGSSVTHIDLNYLVPSAGADLLRSLGVRGSSAELEAASMDFIGHSLSLTILGTYLRDVHGGDARERKGIRALTAGSAHSDHAGRVLASYELWFGAGVEIQALLLLGLFDGPARPSELRAIVAGVAIPGLTDRVSGLDTEEWEALWGRLRRARLVLAANPKLPGIVDAHPLVREYFCSSLRIRFPLAWKKANNRLYEYFKHLLDPRPSTISDLVPALRAIMHACEAGRHSDALHEVYWPHVMRGEENFVAQLPDAVVPLLPVVAKFFQYGDWSRPALHARLDQFVVAMQAGMLLSSARGWGVSEVRSAYQCALECSDTERQRYRALRGLWSNALVRGENKFATALTIADDCTRIAMQPPTVDLLIDTYMTRGIALFYRGELRTAHELLQLAVAGYDPTKHGLNAFVYGLDTRATSLAYNGVTLWLLGFPDAALNSANDSVAAAASANHPFSYAVVLYTRLLVRHYRGELDLLLVEADDVIEYSRRQGFRWFELLANVLKGWAAVMRDKSGAGLELIQLNLQALHRTETVMARIQYVGLLAEALHMLGRTEAALECINDAFDLFAQFEDKSRQSELHRMRGDLFAALKRPREAQIELTRALDIANRQGARSPALRAALSLTTLNGEAIEALRTLYTSFSEGHDTADLAAARRLLCS
jgi:tetratricopeptide (TPR) repeat protein